jgi:hypothetical protein
MGDMIERMARAIEGVVAERLNVGMSDSAAHHAARAALRAVTASDIPDAAVEIARLELIPMADECFMDDHREECVSVIRRALAAAMQKGSEE